MKKLVFILIPMIFITLTSCSNDNGGTGTTDPFGTGGTTGGTGNVTITISSSQEQDGSVIFSGTPSAAVTLSKLTVSVPAEQYTESFQFDGTTVVNANQTEGLVQYPANSGIASGQKWTFQFEGTLASNNQAYNVTSNYTIP